MLKLTLKVQESQQYSVGVHIDKWVMERNRECRNGSTHLRTTDFPRSCEGNSIEKRKPFQEMGLEHLTTQMQKNEL